MWNKLRRWGAAALAFTGLATALSGCGGRTAPLQEYRAQYFEYFDTVTAVTVCAENEAQFEKYEETVRAELERYHQMFDIYHNYNGVVNVKTINDNAGISPVKVEPELFALLQFAAEKYRQTDGRVNVAMGSVLSIWHECRENAMASSPYVTVPDLPSLEKAAEHTDIDGLVLDEKARTVYLTDGKMSLDVGAVAKGFAGHRICEKLRGMGVTSALISLGGNVETIGRRPDGRKWRVGIQNPDTSAETQYLHVVGLEDQALVTSGVYQRYYEVDGVRYHHIISPDTLMPEDTYLSVTILCGSGADADALSTAVFNMTPEDGLAFIEGLENTEAVWIMADGTERYSSGAKQYFDD